MTNEKSAKNSKNGILYLLFGGGIGAVLGLLFASKPGKELRGEIGDAANKGLNRAEAFAGKIGEKAGDIYQDTKTKAGEVYNAAKQKLDSEQASLTDISEKLGTAAEDKGEEPGSDIQSEKQSFNSEENNRSKIEDSDRANAAPKH